MAERPDEVMPHIGGHGLGYGSNPNTEHAPACSVVVCAVREWHGMEKVMRVSVRF